MTNVEKKTTITVSRVDRNRLKTVNQAVYDGNASVGQVVSYLLDNSVSVRKIPSKTGEPELIVEETGKN